MTRAEILRHAPPSGRRETLASSLELVGSVTDGGGCQIVEVGTIRNTDVVGDGWATRMFAWYASRVGGLVTSIDPDPQAIDLARKACDPWSDHIEFLVARAEDTVSRFDRIDLLYMDGPSDAEVHERIRLALECRPALVLWDDIATEGDLLPGAPSDSPGATRLREMAEGAGPWAVKGAIAIPHMLEDGYRIVFAVDRQVLLEDVIT